MLKSPSSVIDYLQCGVVSRAQDHLEGSSDLVECTRSKHLHIQAVGGEKSSVQNRQ